MWKYHCPAPEMEILFLSHRIPFPPDKGDKIRSFQQVQYLARHHNLSIVAATEDRADLRHVPRLEEYADRVEIVPFGNAGALMRVALAMVSGKPLSVAYFPGSQLKAAALRVAAEKRPDMVLAFSSQMAPIALTLGVPVVLDLVDRDSVKWTQYGTRFKGLKGKLYSLEGKRLARAEEEWVRRSAVSLVVSRFERSLFDDSLKDRIRVLSNAIRIEDYPVDRAGEDDRTLLFVGALDYFPNIDAVEFFAREVLPRVLDRVPRAEFLIVGPRAPARLRALHDLPGVRLAGYVQDIMAVYSRAAVSVAPFRLTQGVLNKVLEAMASGIALVATPEAVRGIGLEDGEGVVLGTTPGELADHVVGLLRDREARQDLGRIGCRIVTERYAWPGDMRKLDDVLEMAVNGSNPETMAE